MPLSPQDNEVDLPERVAEAYHEIKKLLLGNKLRPDSRINMVVLSNRLSMSYPPVREALDRLASEFLIYRSKGKGYTVKRMEADEICNMLEVIGLLVKHGVESRRNLLTKEDFEIPSTLLKRNGNPEDQASAAESIFLRYAAFSNNSEIVRIVRNMLDRTHAFRIVDYEDQASVRESVSLLQRVGEQVDYEGLIHLVDRRIIDRKHRVPAVIARINRTWDETPDRGEAAI